MNGVATYENFIKSFTFILGNLSENTALLKNNPDYVGNVSGKIGEALLLGSWDADLQTLEEDLIKATTARQVVDNDEQRNGVKYVVADLATTGKDNTVILVFDGFHLMDYKIIEVSTGKNNADWMLHMAAKHNIPNSHIIWDGTNGQYISDYIPEGKPFISGYAARGKYRREFDRRKAECYMRLAMAINDRRFSIDPKIADSAYPHQKKKGLTILTEFIDECSAVYFIEMPDGRKRLPSKKEMNKNLGDDRSMDLLDPCMMLMSAYDQCEYGQELEYYSRLNRPIDYENDRTVADIYDDTFWC
jgi:hypothetical protein